MNHSYGHLGLRLLLALALLGAWVPAGAQIAPIAPIADPAAPAPAGDADDTGASGPGDAAVSALLDAIAGTDEQAEGLPDAESPAALGAHVSNSNRSSSGGAGLELRIGGRDVLGDDDEGLSAALKLVLGLTALTILPGAMLALTSFTRIAIVLAFVRRAIGTQTLPPNQTLVGLALFLTLFTMWPVLGELHTRAVEPVRAGDMTVREGFQHGADAFRSFMVPRTRERDIALFVELADGPPPEGPEDVSMVVAVPAFIVSELRTAFEMGLVIFVPFVVIDLVVSAVLLALGMMMLPPALVSAPVKLLLFVMVDGWHLVVRSLVESVVMSPDQALLFVREALLTTVMLAAPLLAGGIVVGLLAGVFQAVTSIQDSTLGVSLKLFAIAGIGAALAPWLLRVAHSYTWRAINQISHLGPGAG